MLLGLLFCVLLGIGLAAVPQVTILCFVVGLIVILKFEDVPYFQLGGISNIGINGFSSIYITWVAYSELELIQLNTVRLRSNVRYGKVSSSIISSTVTARSIQ